MKTAHQGVPMAELPGLRGWASAPAATASIRPPGAVQAPERPQASDGVSLDRWFIDKLFGRR
jgi:hypothetical protein